MDLSGENIPNCNFVSTVPDAIVYRDMMDLEHIPGRFRRCADNGNGFRHHDLVADMRV